MKRCKRFLTLPSFIMLGLLLASAHTHHLPGARANAGEPDERLILGVLEHSNDGERKGHSVRVAFYKEGGRWKAYPTDFHTEGELSKAAKSFPESVAWTVCFDGRPYGSLSSKNPKSVGYYKDVGVQQITSEGSVPVAGKPSEAFSGWPGGLTYRPLVLNSRAACADPAGWRPAKPEAADINAVRDYLGKRFTASAAKLSKAKVAANKSYASRVRGAKLVSVNITGAEVIPASSDDDQNKDAWFYVTGKEVTYLGSNMLLVDAGDYDGDGKEEAVFKVQRYDNDGYLLFHDGFEQKLEFSWGYH